MPRLSGIFAVLLFMLNLINPSLAKELPANWGHRENVTLKQLQSSFSEPDMIYAPFMFWFWDEPLNPTKAQQMAKEMLRQGFNPGYIHPRQSGGDLFADTVKTPSLPKDQWLSDAWFNAISGVLDETEQVNGYLGYCDEYMWPSGQAAGRIIKENPELKPISLRWQTFDLKAGQTVNLPESYVTVVAQLADHSGEDTDRSSNPKLGDWIWTNGDSEGSKTRYFRKPFEISPAAEITSATIKLTADDAYSLYLNGQKIGSNTNWPDIKKWDIKGHLRNGLNTIAIEASDNGGYYGLVFGLEITFSDGTCKEIRSDASWFSARQVSEKWTLNEFDQVGWEPVKILGPSDMPPWNMDNSIQRHKPAVIFSKTLRIIGGQESFTWTSPDDGSWRVYSFRKHIITSDNAPFWSSKVNYLDTRLAPTFIKIAHEPYEKQYSGKMGKSLVGVFVDHEGDYGERLCWSEDLEKRYQSKYKTDMKLILPLLLDQDSEGKWAQYRWQWFDAVSDIYSEFFRSVSDWLAKRNMYCISNLWEENLIWQMLMVGDFMKIQRSVSMPGNDCLGLGALNVHDFKETQSVSEFESRRFQSEIMGAAGWQKFTPITIKQAANSVIAWGASHIVPHGVFMTRQLEGNPWVPDWYTENPMWPYLHLWSDFVRRACYINSQGHIVPDVLLVNPMDSVWALSGSAAFDPTVGGDILKLNDWFDKPILDIEQTYSNAIKTLTDNRIEYLIADSYYLRQMMIKKGLLVRGQLQFKTVVLPAMVIWPLDAAQKITDFAEKGGNVYILGQLPIGSTDNGMNDPAMNKLTTHLLSLPSVKICKNLKNEIDSGLPRLKSQIQFLSGEFEMIQLHRKIDKRDFYWLVNNTGNEKCCEVLVENVSGLATKWDCRTGEMLDVPSENVDNGGKIKLKFHPYEAYWLAFDPKRKPMTANSLAEKQPQVVAILDGVWSVHIDVNAQPPQDVAKSLIPLEFVTGSGVEKQLYGWNEWELDWFSGYVDYTHPFELDKTGGRYVLDLGSVRYLAEVWVNGKPAGSSLWPPFEFDITDALRPGNNEIKVRVGNLLCDVIKPHPEAKTPEKDREHQPGLFGPVTISHTENENLVVEERSE